MHRTVTKDLKDDLDTLRSDLTSDIRQLVETATPAVESALQTAKAQGAALGGQVAEQVPATVTSRLPDTVVDRVPGLSKPKGRGKKLLLLGGLAALAAGAVAVWRMRQAPLAGTGTHAGPPPPGHSAPTAVTEEPVEAPDQYDTRL